MTFAIIGGLAGAAAGAAGLGGLTLATGGMLGLAAGSTLGGARAAKSAGETQAAAADRAAELQQQQYEQTRADYAPWRAAGEQALNKLIPLSDYTKFGMSQFQQDPGYAFRLCEGQKALDRSAAARGGLISGSALKAAQRYGQDMGTQDYGRALQDFYGRQEVARNAAAGVAGFGPTSNALAATAGQNYATNAGNLMSNQGYNTANAMLAGERARQSSYGEIGKALGSGGFSNMFGNYGRSEGPVSMPGYGGMYDPAYMGR